MSKIKKKIETRIVPEEAPPKFFAQHFKPYTFISSLIRGKKVIEVGCGDGYGCSFLAESADTVIGIDYDEPSLLKAGNKYRSDNLRFVCMDAAQLAFRESTFDAACSFQVIEHIPEKLLSRYLLEIKRVLRKDGKFYLSTLNLNHAVKSPLTYRKNPAHRKEFTLDELIRLLSGMFLIEQVYGLSLTAKHRFYQRLKKIGISRFLPAAINPVEKFYAGVTTDDFRISCDKLESASDFLIAAGVR